MNNRLNFFSDETAKPKEMGNENSPQVRVFAKTIDSPEERQELLFNLNISSEFRMRYRGLFEYYGKDLIAYKCKYRSNKNVNEFLRIFSNYMTDTLEDNCPPTWDKCESAFWEELIFAHFPQFIYLTPQNKEVEKFLFQLKQFVRWLDKRVGTNWYEMVTNFAVEASPSLQQCEKLLNQIALINHPKIHQKDWNVEQDFEKINQRFLETTPCLDSIFKVTDVMEDTVILTELETEDHYPIKGLPCNVTFPGMLLDGVLGRRDIEIYWNWLLINNVYPEKAEPYITLI